MDVELGVIGGSGLYALRDDAQFVELDTPDGPTSGPNDVIT
jgi:purine nucleoside phosphorylase